MNQYRLTLYGTPVSQPMEREEAERRLRKLIYVVKGLQMEACK